MPMIDTHQPPFSADTTYEAAHINLWTDENVRRLGFAVETPQGQRVMIGLSSAQLHVLVVQIGDAREVHTDLRDWQPFRPA